MAEFDSARDCVDSLLEMSSPLELARYLDVNNAHIYRAKQGDFTNLLLSVLRERGLIPPKESRIRLAADLSREQREILKNKAKDYGYDSWTEFCRAWADDEIDLVRLRQKFPNVGAPNE